MTAASAQNYDFMVNGIYYKINQDSVSVGVTYKKSIYSNSETYTGHVAIPEEVSYGDMNYTVTAIDAYAFYNCDELISVELPGSVIMIKEYAFQGCTALSSVIIPDSVISIGIDAFNKCQSLTELFIPASVRVINPGTFSGCYGLTSIVVDENNLYFDSRENCNAIIGKERNELIAACINTEIPNSVKRIARDAFGGFTWLTEVNLPDSLEYIGQNAFYGCIGLTSIDIPNTVTEIDDCAFAYCSGLTEVVLPESLITLGGCVFMDCTGLTSMFIPASVEYIGSNLLARASNITSINVDHRNRYYDSRNNCNAIIQSKTNSLIIGCNYTTIPEGIVNINEGAFTDCDKITNIVLPSTLYVIRYGAFYNCTALTSIVIPEGVVQIAGEAFRNCINLTSVSLPSTLHDVGAFSIGVYCFYGCNSLKDVICFSQTPPQIFSYGCFEMTTYQDATLYVPSESITNYQSAAFWRKFISIKPINLIIHGDVDGDGKLGINDVTDLIDLLLNGGEMPSVADVDGDGIVNISDVTALIDLLLNQ